MYPEVWQSNLLQTSSGKDHVPVGVQKEGEIAVTDDPFTWRPSALDPSVGLNLVSVFATDEHPDPVPSTSVIENMTKWVSDHGGIGWRQVDLTTVNAPTFTALAPYEQGSEAYNIAFVIKCENVPLGSFVGFSSGTPTGSHLIYLPKTQVSSQPTFSAGMQAEVRAGFATNISYSWWSNGQPLPANARISLTAYIVAPNSGGQTVTEAGLEEVLFHDPDGRVEKGAAYFDSKKLKKKEGFNKQPR